MTYEFAKYPDGTLGVFSNIGKKENGEEYIRITFERPKEYGFDTYVIELPSYEVVFEDGNYTDIRFIFGLMKMMSLYMFIFQKEIQQLMVLKYG